MTPGPRLWVATFAGLVFLIGLMAGIVVDRTWLDRSGGAARIDGPGRTAGPARGRGQNGADRIAPPVGRLVALLDATLELTPEQRARVADILEARRPRLRRLQEDTRQQFISEQQQLQEEIAEVLTGDQLARFRALIAREPGTLGPGPGRNQGGGRAGRRGGRE